VSYALVDRFDVERLVLLGHADIDGTGDDTDNEIAGNSGNNRLTGLRGNDIFVFREDFGNDTIVDFKPGKDRIDISAATDIDSFAELKPFIRQKGSDVEIQLADDVILVRDTAKGDLHQGDFIFDS
jgi:serralysin